MIEETNGPIKAMTRSSYDGVVMPDLNGMCQTGNRECYPTAAGGTGESGWKDDDPFKCMVESSPEAFWQMDNNLIFTFTNSACEKLSGGFSKEDLIGRSLLEFLTPEGVDHLWRMNGLRSKKEDQGIKTDLVFYELQMKRKNGSYFWAGISSSPLRDSQGQVIGYHGVMRDVSAFKQYEADRNQPDDVRKKAEKMTVVGNMTGVVVHELNNVMAGVLGYSQLLLMQDESGGNDFHKQVESIIRTGEQATAIIQDLLVIAGKDGPSHRSVNLNELILGCLKKNEFQKLSERYPGITVHLDLEVSLHPVKGSRQQLDKSICNLLFIAYEKAGAGGEVTISTRTVYLGRPIDGYEDLREGEYVVLSVTDNGAGLADEDAAHVFEPFYIKKVMNKGITGLELTVVREVVRDHNGFIDVAAKIGCGATFTVYLPVSHADMQGNHYRVS